ncbi:MAG: PD-(D/E)XK motif protein [Actinomycetes bacterium]
MIDEIRAGFAGLIESGLPASGFEVLAPPGLPAGTRLGIDSEGCPCLIVDVTGARGPVRSTEALTVQTAPLDLDGTVTECLIVRCPIIELFKVFDQFVAAVIDLAVDAAIASDEAASQVIDKWQALLAVRGQSVGRQKAASTIAEMLVLVDCLEQDPLGRVDQWTGTTNARHDFRRGTSAVEVKSTLQHTGMKVTIHGADQLMEPEGGDLHVHLVRLEEVPNGDLTLGRLFDAAVDRGVDALALYEKLAEAGIPIDRMDEADEHKFDLRERITLPINLDSPRIVPGSFTGGHVPAGTDDITYSCDLAVMADARMSKQEWLEVVRRLVAVEV